MKKTFLGVLALSGVVGLGLVGTVMANSAVDGALPAMMASPQMIVLAKVTTLTIHTNIPATDVDLATVALNGVAPTGLGVDNCGHLVAKFAVADLALDPGEVTLTLTGLYDDDADEDTAFAASCVVTAK